MYNHNSEVKSHETTSLKANKHHNKWEEVKNLQIKLLKEEEKTFKGRY